QIVAIGGGAAGLYFAILMKRADPRHQVTVIERNGPDDTFGFGVVFSDATLDNFLEADPITHTEITQAFAHWDNIDVHYRGEVLTSTGHGFSGLGPLALRRAVPAPDRLAPQPVRLAGDDVSVPRLHIHLQGDGPRPLARARLSLR